MERSEAVCRRCGREAPAMSDCGGFYDLVPQAGQAIPVAAVEAQPAKKNGLLSFLCAVLAILLAASVIACVVISAEKQALAEEVEELEELLEESAPLQLPGKDLSGPTQTEGADTTADTGTGDATVEANENTEA